MDFFHLVFIKVLVKDKDFVICVLVIIKIYAMVMDYVHTMIDIILLSFGYLYCLLDSMELNFDVTQFLFCVDY